MKQTLEGKTKYTSWIFINGVQCGDNNTFADWFATDAEAIADARQYFESQGYVVEENYIIADAILWPANQWSGEIRGPVNFVKLTTKAKNEMP